MNQVLADRYRIDAEIGRGAAGVVHRAHDLITGEDVAIKILHADAAAEPTIATAFLDEAEVLTELNHPGIVRPRDLIVNGSLMALVMDLVDGDDVRRTVAENGPMPHRRAVEIVSEAAEALAAVHDKDIVHGDVKPGNILIPADGGSVRLVDFGVARRTASADAPTHATPDYTAPEIIGGAASSDKSDVYGLGLVLYEALCGPNPYRGGTVEEVLQRHRGSIPVRPSCIPVELWNVIESCLAADPAQRPAAQAIPSMLRPVLSLVAAEPSPPQTAQLRPRTVTAAGTAMDLVPVAMTEPGDNASVPAGVPMPPSQSQPKRGNKSKLIVAVAAGVVTLAAATVIGFAWFNSVQGSADGDNREPQAEEQTQSEDERKEPKQDKEKKDSTPSDSETSSDEPSQEPTGESTEDSDAGGDGDDESDEGTSEGDFPGGGPIGSEFPDKPGGR